LHGEANADGIFAVRSYTGLMNFGREVSNPQLPPADDIDYQRTATAQWKTEQFDWSLLRGLLETER
jgi:hypothetical protein